MSPLRSDLESLRRIKSPVCEESGKPLVSDFEKREGIHTRCSDIRDQYEEATWD